MYRYYIEDNKIQRERRALGKQQKKGKNLKLLGCVDKSV
jgi:hypothetical protein